MCSRMPSGGYGSPMHSTTSGGHANTTTVFASTPSDKGLATAAHANVEEEVAQSEASPTKGARAKDDTEARGTCILIFLFFFSENMKLF